MAEDKIINWSQMKNLVAEQWNIVPNIGQVYVSQDDIDYSAQLGGNPDVVLVDRTAASSRMRQYVIQNFIPQERIAEVSLNQPTSFDTIFLEPEQKELLSALVAAHRRVPRNERQDFVFHIARIHKGAHSRAKMHEIIDNGSSIRLDNNVITKKEDIPKELDQDFITHPGLDNGSIDTHLNDVDALKLQNFIYFRDESRFCITPQGFAYFERMTSTHPQPTQEPAQETSMPTTQPISKVPRAFMSYSWDSDEHREWVRDVATRLRDDGVDVTLDRWHAVPGDQLSGFMETAVRENDYVLIVCTPDYKQKSDERKGGVGYEGDIMTAEAFTSRNHRKFIPLLRAGEWKSVAPSWLGGKYYIDLRGNPYSEEHYQDLLVTLRGQREQAPPSAQLPLKERSPKAKSTRRQLLKSNQLTQLLPSRFWVSSSTR